MRMCMGPRWPESSLLLSAPDLLRKTRQAESDFPHKEIGGSAVEAQQEISEGGPAKRSDAVVVATTRDASPNDGIELVWRVRRAR